MASFKDLDPRTTMNIYVDGKILTSMTRDAAIKFAKTLRKQGHSVRLIATSELYIPIRERLGTAITGEF